MENKGNVIERARIHYVEPNQIVNGETSGLGGGYIAPLEDYSHAVDLEVIYSSRDSCGLGERKKAEYHLVNERVSMMHGTSGVLTTNYTDVDMSSPDNNTNECLGIQSIDITYNGDSPYFSFCPMVSIVFVDTRGISLMNKEENGRGSIFNSLFSYPFPVFKLRVKGFYGGEVCYVLKPHKMAQIEFDSATGNAIIRTDFIGYNGGIYNDIPLQYLAVAPYMDYVGNAHWNKSVEDGHFAFDGGDDTTAPMISFPEFRRRIAQVETSQEFKDAKKNIEESSKNYDGEKNKVTDVVRSLPFRGDDWKEYNKEGYFVKIGTGKTEKDLKEIKKSFKNFKKYLKKKHKKDENYEKYLSLTEFINEDNVKYCRIQRENGDFKHIEEGEWDFSPYFKMLKEQLESCTLSTFNLFFVECPQSEKTLVERFNELLEKIDEKKEEEINEYYKQKEIAFQNALGFAPTIKNIFHLLFAHMETFMVSFYQCLTQIRHNLDNTDGGEQEKRTVGHFNTSLDNTDVTDGTQLLPPFPIFTEKKIKGKDEYTETIWPQSSDMDEVLFVESLLRGARQYNEEQLTIDLEIAKSKSEEEGRDEDFSELEQAYKAATSAPITKDMKLNTYLMLKEIYDRWICTAERNRWILGGEGSDFDRFMFIDSFYNDIGNNIIVDPEEFMKFLSYQLPTGNNSIYARNHSTFDYMNEAAGLCDGMLLDIPLVYGIENDERLAQLFEVVPVIKSDESDNEKFVFLYNYKPSEHLNVGDDFNDDSFMIEEDLLPSALYRTENSNTIPAFGVTFARQNQGIFKNISVESSKPNLTDKSIAKTMEIAAQANRGPRESTLYGQNIYSALSSAQYRSEITMMGDAQIMPLMYYQLNNIPFWKGTYMLTKVNHTITPSDMTTTFSGYRINRNTLPLNGGDLPVIKNPGEMLIKINNKPTKIDMGTNKSTDSGSSETPTVDLNADFTIDTAHTSTNWTSTRTKSIDYIVIHYTAGSTSRKGKAIDTARQFATSSRAASADFIVDDADIVQYNPNPLKRYTYAVGGDKLKTKGGTLHGIASNRNTMSIEICSSYNGKLKQSTPPNDEGWYFTDAVLANAIKLTKFLMEKYGIDKSHVIRHYDVTGKYCPGIIGWNKESGSEDKWEWFKGQL